MRLGCGLVRTEFVTASAPRPCEGKSIDLFWSLYCIVGLCSSLLRRDCLCVYCRTLRMCTAAPVLVPQAESKSIPKFSRQGAVWGVLGVLGASWGRRGSLRGPLGDLLEVSGISLGGLLGPLGFIGASWRILDAAGGFLVASLGVVLGRLGGDLGSFWGLLGVPRRHPGTLWNTQNV